MRLLEIPKQTFDSEIARLEALESASPTVIAAIYTLRWLRDGLSMSPYEMYAHEQRGIKSDVRTAAKVPLK